MYRLHPDAANKRRRNPTTGVQASLAILSRALDAVEETCSPFELATVLDIHRRRVEHRLVRCGRWLRKAA